MLSEDWLIYLIAVCCVVAFITVILIRIVFIHRKATLSEKEKIRSIRIKANGPIYAHFVNRPCDYKYGSHDFCCAIWIYCCARKSINLDKLWGHWEDFAQQEAGHRIIRSPKKPTKESFERIISEMKNQNFVKSSGGDCEIVAMPGAYEFL